MRFLRFIYFRFEISLIWKVIYIYQNLTHKHKINQITNQMNKNIWYFVFWDFRVH